jgi:hypothetical protein
MRLLLVATALLALSGGGLAATRQPARDMPVINPDASAPVACPPTSRYEAARRGGRLAPQYLDELPGADLYKAVYRHIGRCNVPIIVRYNIGGTSGAASGRR